MEHGRNGLDGLSQIYFGADFGVKKLIRSTPLNPGSNNLRKIY